MQIKEKNWMNVYPNTYKEEEIPTIEGDVNIEEIRIEEKMTKPPARYTAASLVKELEKRNLGTKSTRANILETLESRGYIRGKSIEVTELGQRITETLKKYSPVIIDDELTRQFEEEMEQISSLTSGWQEKENVLLGKAKTSIGEIAKGITANLTPIGEALAEANEAGYKQQAEENTLSVCPVCKKGNLRIMFGRKFKRYFVSCDAYPECKTIFSLPPGGMIKPAKKKDENDKEKEIQELCVECNSPMVISLRRGKKPWKFCFNPKCKTNEEWVKKKAEYAAKMKGESSTEASKDKEEDDEDTEEKVEDKSHEETEMS
jgi:DNA topoisomerase I